LALKIKPQHVAETAEERKKVLLELLEEIIDVKDKPVNYDDVKPRNTSIPVYRGRC
jgi:hypothetical protein